MAIAAREIAETVAPSDGDDGDDDDDDGGGGDHDDAAAAAAADDDDDGDCESRSQDPASRIQIQRFRIQNRGCGSRIEHPDLRITNPDWNPGSGINITGQNMSQENRTVQCKITECSGTRPEQSRANRTVVIRPSKISVGLYLSYRCNRISLKSIGICNAIVLIRC